MRTTIRAEIPDAAYDVTIGPGVIADAGSLLREVTAAARVAVVTDDQVAPRYLPGLVDSLETAGFDTGVVTVPAGEESKSWQTAGRVLEDLVALGLDRTDVIVALGGGVVGDLAGFCAGVYMRGIGFAQVPTTLLAQVDSSVGGKTAVDLDAGKNLAGVFVQPLMVAADTSTLQTLPEMEWGSGLAEVAKSAVLDGEEFCGWLETHASELEARSGDPIRESVGSCVAFKARVVAADEREAGVRESLNLGHTLGHALEKVAGYGVIPHGVAVAEGMRFAARLAQRVADAPAEFTLRQEALLDSLGLHALGGVWDAEELRSAMSSDKKARSGRPRFVLATGPGTHVVTYVDEAVLAEELRAWALAARARGETP